MCVGVCVCGWVVVGSFWFLLSVCGGGFCGVLRRGEDGGEDGEDREDGEDGEDGVDVFYVVVWDGAWMELGSRLCVGLTLARYIRYL